MRSCDEMFRARPWQRLIAVSLLGLGIAGCSSDANRLDPLSNPYASRNNPPASDVTGSISRKPAPTVASRPLPPPTRPPVSRTGVSGGAKGMATYRPQHTNTDVTGSVTPAATHRARNAGWDRNGGTTVTVAYGETLYAIATRYGVPVSAIMQANNITNAKSVQPGQRLVIPRYRYHTAASAPPARPKPIITGSVRKPAPRATGAVHVVAPGDTLMRLSRRYHVSLIVLARANNIPPHARLKIGDRVVIPGARSVTPVAAAPRSVPIARQIAARQTAARQRVVAAESPHVARTVTPSNDQPTVHKTKTASADGATTSFRWPVRGRIISAYGPKPTGQKNDGINLAVPVGTPIKAAEGGLVVYVGNELKGYGNLVLVRHGNGFVTAYAHTSKILVKRGDSVKRGQVIANAGQTGNVASPQLHFEIRKGSQPVDPTKYLSGA